jgi:hypothetical protein
MNKAQTHVQIITMKLLVMLMNAVLPTLQIVLEAHVRVSGHQEPVANLIVSLIPVIQMIAVHVLFHMEPVSKVAQVKKMQG